MPKLRDDAKAPIAYNYADAAEAIGQSIDTIKVEVRKGNLTPRYINSKPVILRADLVDLVENAPSERPAVSA